MQPHTGNITCSYYKHNYVLIGASLSKAHNYKHYAHEFPLSVCLSVCQYAHKQQFMFCVILHIPTFNKHCVNEQVNKWVIKLRSNFSHNNYVACMLVAM